jgi:hypothetical protein
VKQRHTNDDSRIKSSWQPTINAVSLKPIDQPESVRSTSRKSSIMTMSPKSTESTRLPPSIVAAEQTAVTPPRRPSTIVVNDVPRLSIDTLLPNKTDAVDETDPNVTHHPADQLSESSQTRNNDNLPVLVSVDDTSLIPIVPSEHRTYSLLCSSSIGQHLSSS